MSGLAATTSDSEGHGLPNISDRFRPEVCSSASSSSFKSNASWTNDQAVWKRVGVAATTAWETAVCGLTAAPAAKFNTRHRSLR